MCNVVSFLHMYIQLYMTYEMKIANTGLPLFPIIRIGHCSQVHPRSSSGSGPICLFIFPSGSTDGNRYIERPSSQVELMMSVTFSLVKLTTRYSAIWNDENMLLESTISTSEKVRTSLQHKYIQCINKKYFSWNSKTLANRKVAVTECVF